MQGTRSLTQHQPDLGSRLARAQQPLPCFCWLGGLILFSGRLNYLSFLPLFSSPSPNHNVSLPRQPPLSKPSLFILGTPRIQTFILDAVPNSHLRPPKSNQPRCNSSPSSSRRSCPSSPPPRMLPCSTNPSAPVNHRCLVVTPTTLPTHSRSRLSPSQLAVLRPLSALVAWPLLLATLRMSPCLPSLPSLLCLAASAR